MKCVQTDSRKRSSSRSAGRSEESMQPEEELVGVPSELLNSYVSMQHLVVSLIGLFTTQLMLLFRLRQFLCTSVDFNAFILIIHTQHTYNLFGTLSK